MIARLHPYPSYKDSCVEWLGAVPEHWDVKRVRNLVDMRVSNVDKHANQDEVSVRLCNYVDVYKNDRITERIPFMRATASPEEIERFRLEKGDVLITKDSESWQDIASPALVQQSADDLICGYHLALLRPLGDRLIGDYLLRTLQSNGVSYQFQVEANGVTRYGLSHQAIKSVRLPVPPCPEQTAIVRFLDHYDRRIRRYIRSKQKLIKLLEEQKQAIIHRAVTRGLNLDVPMKDSGLPWCPRVPFHWELKSNRDFLQQRKVLVGERHPDYTLLSLTKRGIIARDLSENKGKFSSDMGSFQEVRPGDLVMCLFDVPETPRTVGLSSQSGMITGAYTVFEFRDREFAKWIETFYIAMDDRKLLSPLYSGLRNTIPRPRFLGAKTPVPPSAERSQILTSVEAKSSEASSTVAHAEREISLLREYHTRLIADVVTGKIDVREAATSLPAESERPDPLDEVDEVVDDNESMDDNLDVAPEDADIG